MAALDNTCSAIWLLNACFRWNSSAGISASSTASSSLQNALVK